MATPSVLPPDDLLPSPEPRRGGMIRFLSGDPSIGRAVVRSNVAEGVRRGGLLLAWRKPREGAPCWILELRPGAAFPDGTPVTAGDVARYWIDTAGRPLGEAEWLLEPLRAPSGDGGPASIASAIDADGALLEVCPVRPTPDLPERLEHPALWPLRGDVTGPMEGPGPFFEAPDGTLWPNPGYTGPGPYVDHVEPMDVEGDPTVPLRLGDAHVAVVLGKAARALRESPGPSKLRLDRLPAWDRTYFLWMQPNKRWVNDPEFRSWISKTLERDEIVRYVFDGQGQRAFLLSASGSESDIPKYKLNPNRMLAPTTVPRLELVYEASDGHAEILARRIQAVLATEDVVVTLAGVTKAELRERLAHEDVEMALLAHRPSSTDPVLALLETVWWLGPAAGPERKSLVLASSAVDPAERELRRAAAWQIELELLEKARVLPLIRLEAWIARHPALAGVAPGRDGVLRLEDAWWLP